MQSAMTYQPAQGRRVRPLGELAERMARCADRLLLDDVYRPEWITSDVTFDYDPTPFHDWYSGHEWTWYADVSARYLNAWVSLAASTGELPPKARHVLDMVLAAQADDGHFGPALEMGACDRSQASGTAWMMLALPRVYALTGDERALLAARRLAEWYATVTPEWLRPEEVARQTSLGSYALIFSNFTHCLDGLAALQAVDPDAGCEPVAMAIADAVKSFDTEIHSHHFLSTLRGLLDWYELTGRPHLLEKVRREVDRIYERGMLDTWGVPESFATPHTDEGCSEVDWALTNLRLYQATGERRYLDTAERAVFGHLFMNQSPNGGFGAWSGFHAPVGARKAGSVGRYVEAFWCCSMHGGFGLCEVARHVFGRRRDGIQVNLPLGAEAEFPVAGGLMQVRQTATAYPFPGEVCTEVAIPDDTPQVLRVALPSHSPLRSAHLNGIPQTIPPGQTELTVPLRSPGKSRLSLAFDVGLRAEPARRQDLFPGKRSLWFGPMPLGTNAFMERVACALDPRSLGSATLQLAGGQNACAAELEIVLPAGDAEGFSHSRSRRNLVLYPLAARAFRGMTQMTYLF